MKNSEALEPIAEAIYWLSQNDEFVKEVSHIRKTNNIPSRGLKKRNLIEWYNNLNLEGHKQFEADLSKLVKRCSLFYSCNLADFIDILRIFICTNEIFHRRNRLSRALPQLVAQMLGSRIKLEISIWKDTGKREIGKIVNAHWQEIRRLQKSVGDKITKDSPNFVLNKEIWNMYKSSKYTKPNILDKYERQLNYDPENLNKTLHRIKTKIKKSFR